MDFILFEKLCWLWKNRCKNTNFKNSQAKTPAPQNVTVTFSVLKLIYEWPLRTLKAGKCQVVLANLWWNILAVQKLKTWNLTSFQQSNKNLSSTILAAFDKEQDSLSFLNFLKNKHPNIKFTIEKQIPSLFLMYTFQVSIIKISHCKHNTNWPIQAFS